MLGSLPASLPSRFAPDHPVMVKFLMSQFQSDVSSVRGSSNVESGSQPDVDNVIQRHGSLTSVTSEVMSAGDENIVKNNGGLFSTFLDVLSGSTETVTSSQGLSSKETVTAARSLKISNELKPDGKNAVSDQEPRESINSANSISFINKPLDKVGFVTLEALMNGDTDIGKLLNKSLESIERGVIPEGASLLQKQASNGSQFSGHSEEKEADLTCNRRDSSFSISSDGGSDLEKKKVSMKYMGTLPEGMNYEAFVKHMSQENKDKSLMFTVFSSPEVSSRLRRAPDTGLKSPPLLKLLAGATGQDCGYRSDTNSTRTLTDINDVESQSAKSTHSLGEQIKQMCDRQKSMDDQTLDIQTPITGTETMDDVTPRPSGRNLKHDSGLKIDGLPLSQYREIPVKDCSVILQEYTSASKRDPPTKQESQKNVSPDTGSPVRKRLKSKKERDQMSRRKQKESFILQSDTNSDGENASIGSSPRWRQTLRTTTRSEEELVQSGSEEITPRPSQVDRQRSLLDEVQLETPSDSCEDKAQRASAISMSSDRRLR